jgi:flagellar biosynthesis protein FlhB
MKEEVQQEHKSNQGKPAGIVKQKLIMAKIKNLTNEVTGYSQMQAKLPSARSWVERT